MKQFMLPILAFLGITAFNKENGKMIMTDEQRDRIVAAFGQPLYDKFSTELANDFKVTEPGGVNYVQALLESTQAAFEANKVALSALESNNATLETEKATMTGLLAQQKAQIDILSALPVIEKPATPILPVSQFDQDVQNDQFLMGLNVPFMAIDEKHNYNKRAYAALMSDRLGLDIPTPKQSVLDYQSLKADLGDFYRIRKQDSIQSFLYQLPSVEALFPLQSGFQDRAVLVQMFMDEFSQADNTSSDFDNVYKGNYLFQPEELKMSDVMFAYKFSDLKKLEKTWIGYLNKEGSDTMKWSFIEFIMVETGKKLHNEREQRRIAGISKDPVLNNPGKAMQASDGLYQFIKNKIANFQIRPFAEGEWTDNDISDYIRRCTALVPPVVRDTGNLILYITPDALTAYHRNNQTLYGLNQDYTANINYVKEYPNVKIKTVTNAGNRKRMIWTIDGNINLFEDQKGEMFKFFFEQEDWKLKVWSNWREAIGAFSVGKKFDNADDIPMDYSTQMIFCNDVDIPSTVFVEMFPDDATPSVKDHTSVISVANTAGIVITDIDDAEVGVPVKIKCGSPTNSISIAASGKFSLLSTGWNPVVGDVINLMKTSSGKFTELSRETIVSSLIAFAPDDATPSLTGSDKFVTDANANDTAITNFDNAIPSRIYTVYGAGDAHASTIDNAGNFALELGAMTLSAGTWIKLVLNTTDSKFHEISRG